MLQRRPQPWQLASTFDGEDKCRAARDDVAKQSSRCQDASAQRKQSRPGGDADTGALAKEPRPRPRHGPLLLEAQGTCAFASLASRRKSDPEAAPSTQPTTHGQGCELAPDGDSAAKSRLGPKGILRLRPRQSLKTDTEAAAGPTNLGNQFGLSARILAADRLLTPS